MRLVVDADKRDKPLVLKELLHYNDLFYILAYHNLRVRYAQTFLRLVWAFLQLQVTLIYHDVWQSSEGEYRRNFFLVVYYDRYCIFDMLCLCEERIR